MKSNPPNFGKLISGYNSFKEDRLSGRYVIFSHLLPVLNKLSQKFEVREIGKSVLGIPIKCIILGKGEKKVLAWSQMHGNESTTTKAVFDFLNFLNKNPDDNLVNFLLENLQMCIIPMLNPDGAKAYTRVNANEVDLNRDAHKLTQPESRILREQYVIFKPDFCFNLHDQRSIFSAGPNRKPATLSFLTPSMDEERSLTKSRKASMRLIVAMAEEVGNFIPGQIGRYDDSFNINCTGDTFQSQKTPTILFEAGHFPGDYSREETRKYVWLALLKGFYTIASNGIKAYKWKNYFKIPENEKPFNDVLLKNALVNGEKNEVAIQFKEALKGDKIEFIPIIDKIGENIGRFGHKEIDCKEFDVGLLDGKQFNENVIVDKIRVKNEIIPIIKR